GVHVDADAIAELAAEQLIHRNAERLTREIPQRRLDRGKHRDIHSGLRTLEETPAPDVLEKAVHVQRVLPLQPLAEHFHQMIRAGDGIDTLAAAPDALVRVDLHEEAGSAADVATLHVCDLEFG